MGIKTKKDFINAIQALKITTPTVIVKPNWVAIDDGVYTQAEVLDWTLEALENKEKIIVESYTPWRGLQYLSKDVNDLLAVDLINGKKYWDFYKKSDEHFFKETGIGLVLNKHNAKYINVTNEVWANKCVDKNLIKKLVEANGHKIFWEEFLSYIPQNLYDIRTNSTFISLSKIKTEETIMEIGVSMSVKNLFGLIPHPSRQIPFHHDEKESGHNNVTQSIKDIYNVWTSVFPENRWICEGLTSLVRRYEGADQQIIKNKNLLFTGFNGIEVDREACNFFDIDYRNVEHLN